MPSSSWWTPPDQVTTEQIGRARKPAQAGTPFSLAVGAQPAFGTPAPEMRTVMSGPISKSYGAEWHSEVIEPLMALGADWLHAIVTGGESLPAGTPVADTVRRLNFADLGDTTLLPGIPSYERDYIRKAFTRDAAIAEDLDATINVTSMFEPMLEHRGYRPALSGDTTMSIAVPNFALLDWSAIAEFREHPGVTEAREMLVRIEQIAARSPDDMSRRIAAADELTATLFAAITDRQTSIPKELGAEVAKAGISFIPAVGPPLSVAMSGGQVIAKGLSERRSGLAALMRLRAAAQS